MDNVKREGERPQRAVYAAPTLVKQAKLAAISADSKASVIAKP